MCCWLHCSVIFCLLHCLQRLYAHVLEVFSSELTQTLPDGYLMSPLVLPVWQPVCIAYMQDACQLYWLNHRKSHHPWSPCCSFSTLLPFAQKGGGAPNFRPMSIVAKWLDGSRWHGTGPQSRPHCARWDPAPLPKKGVEPPIFWPISVVAKRMDASICHLVWR